MLHLLIQPKKTGGVAGVIDVSLSGVLECQSRGPAAGEIYARFHPIFRLPQAKKIGVKSRVYLDVSLLYLVISPISRYIPPISRCIRS